MMTSSSSYRRNSLKNSEFITRVKRTHSRKLSDEALEDLGITEYKAIELKRLAQTFLVSDGAIDKFLRFERCLRTIGSTARCSTHPD